METVPVGYADGIRRALTNNCDVLIGGRRYPLVGTVSMDNITVELGSSVGDVRCGDRVTIIGLDGDEQVHVELAGGKVVEVFADLVHCPLVV